MSKQKQLKVFGFQQQLKEEYWDWSDAEKQQYFKDATSVMRRICERIHYGLQQAGESGDDLKFEFAGINHDKDMNEINGVFHPVEPHIHGVVTLTKKRDLNVISQWLGLKPQQIDIPKGRYGKENMLAYLIHAKDPKKYQYDPTEVETFGTFDYMAYYNGKKQSWEKRRAVVQSKDNKEAAEWLKMQVQQGLLDMRQIMENPEYKMIYADNMRLIDDAVKFYNMDKGYKMLRELENKEFELSVFFITGESNSGKSTMARVICEYLKLMFGWERYEASASNPLDDYASQEILFLDEVRPYSYTAPEWLQMLDPRGNQTLKARYYNKMRAYKAIIITSPVEDPYTFFSQVRGERGELEPLDQFIRRLNGHIRVVRVEGGKRYAYYEKTAISDFPMLYDEGKKEFLKGENDIVLSNGIPLLEENRYDDFKEYRGGPRKVHFGMVPYSEGYVEKEVAVAKDSEGVTDYVSDIMKDILKDVEYNNDPKIKHDEERPSMREVLGQKALNTTAKSLGLEFSRKKGDVEK